MSSSPQREDLWPTLGVSSLLDSGVSPDGRGPYFVDFLCREHRVVLEIDGETHGTKEELTRDAVRTAYLKAEGYRVFRAFNGDIYHNLDGVLDGLLAFIEQCE